MTAATEVARIRREFAARDAEWTAAVKARLRDGPATTSELYVAAMATSKGIFNNLLTALRRAGVIVVVETRVGRTGSPLNVWGLG